MSLKRKRQKGTLSDPSVISNDSKTVIRNTTQNNKPKNKKGARHNLEIFNNDNKVTKDLSEKLVSTTTVPITATTSHSTPDSNTNQTLIHEFSKNDNNSLDVALNKHPYKNLEMLSEANYDDEIDNSDQESIESNMVGNELKSEEDDDVDKTQNIIMTDDFKVNEKIDRPIKSTINTIDPNAISNFSPNSSNVFHSSTVNSNTHERVCLVAMKAEETICFQGYVLVAPLFGQVTIMGHRLRGIYSSETIHHHQQNHNARKISQKKIDSEDELTFWPVFSPKTHGLIVIKSMTVESIATELPSYKMSNGGIKASNALKTTINELLINLISECVAFDSIVAFCEMSWCGIDGVERTSIFKNIFSKDRTRNTDNMTFDKTDAFSIPGFYPILEPMPGIIGLHFPDSWMATANQILIESLDNNITDGRAFPVIILFGHKKVGKSTFSKFLINTLLNRHPRIAYIESDIGQPEFTPSGIVSLSIVDSPIFGPPFTHPKLPYRSYLIGHTNPRDDPDYYLACLQELVAVFRRDFVDSSGYDNIKSNSNKNKIPLIINTHGWVKGLGYDLFLQLHNFAKPTHLCQFQSLTNPYLNPPTLPSNVLHPEDRPFPKLYYVDSILFSPNPARFTARDQRTLMLISYFYSVQSFSKQLISQQGFDQGWWNFDIPLVQQVPWCLDWTKGLSKGVFTLCAEVPYSQLLYALNGSIVGLIGDFEVEEDEMEYEGNDNYLIQEDNSNNNQTGSSKIIPPPYFPSPKFPPPPPAHHTCFGLAIIRSIDPSTHTFHILTPLSISILKRVNGIVKGSLELPVCVSIDETSKTSVGLYRVPWKKVPYLSLDVGGGAGHAAQRVRRNLMRRGQMNAAASIQD
ncbi:4313_t:CDS:10 [Ambispora leptoticha]|uniref:Polynucleotide 5'-hydroxyl-kinase GRC3 n=1 Tax=Ambispora leptoticha TaxID=144679 RepID=A0A9N8VMK9_9GLOM|nr:4313_t:CDS:10 [Ambispora leptoticha]